jgi:predicted XRE-type DNA-binding protein
MDEGRSTEITRGHDNVFEDLGFPADEAANLAIRTDLMLDLKEWIQARGWTRAEAAAFFDEPETKIESLVAGDVEGFSVDELIVMLAKAGMRVKVEVLPAAA